MSQLVMPPALTIVVSLALLAIFAMRHFGTARAGAIAVGCFAAMPVVWLAARGGATQVILLPFILGWLLCLDVFHRLGNPAWLALGGAAAAMMIHMHLAGVVLAPVHLALTAVILLPRHDRIVTIGALVGGFVLVAFPWVVAVLRDEQLISGPVNAYGLYDANRFNVLQGMREITSWVGLTVRSEVYWDCFNPALLFLGRGGLAQSLIGSGVFLLPLAVPLARGLLAYALHPRGTMDGVVLGAFIAAPAAAALIAQPPEAPRLILLAPAAAVIAARGCYRGAFRSTPAGSPAAPSTSKSTLQP